eukprot:TRINITY_DN12462_c0_g1_i1.p1 TRINITY_DN12462_c0_g1~~TRINITY_DN12462_c0_g1_i1.p1  ORF type:complete len:183 (-),score=33.43 TRINITY_DN12462_c0_g1_i1:58-606(-)
MGLTISSLFNTYFGNKEVRILMVGLDAAGKTTVLYRLKLGEVVTTIPTLGFNVETVTYKNISFTVWDVGGQERIRRLWRHYYDETDGVIFVVDSNDHARMADARREFEGLMNEPSLRASACLIFCNKQDLPNAMSVAEVTDALGLRNISQRDWHVQGAVATDGQGLTEGLDWLSKTMTERGL